MADPVNFTRPAAERIARVVRAVEGGNRDGTGPTFDRPWYGGGGGSVVRLCKTTATWSKDSVASLEIWESGTTPNETISAGKTVTATNHQYPVAACVWVEVAKAKNGTFYLIDAGTPNLVEGCAAPNIGGHDLTTVSGYASNKKQALTHDENACLKWVDIEECD
jgi:hypothetical protein